MATEILDVHNIPAIPLPAEDDKVHRTVSVGQTQCRGGASVPKLKELLNEHSKNYFTHYFQDTLPNQFLQFNMQNAQQCVEQLR